MEIVVAHQERAVLRVGETFLKVDVDHERTAAEVEAMRRAPVPTPTIVRYQPPVRGWGETVCGVARHR